MTRDAIPPDLLRALAEGTLPPEEERRVLALVSGDPVAAADLAAMVQVLALAADPAPPPVSSVTADGMLARIDGAAVPTPSPAGRRILRRRLLPLAAAGVLVAAGLAGASLLLRGPQGPATVALAILGGSPPVASAQEPEPVPAALLAYEPDADGTIRWLPTVEEGRALARLAGRPVLVYLFHPSCPLCRRMGETTFRDAAVRAAARSYVPVRVDVTEGAGEMDVEEIFRRGWPYMATQDADGATLREFPGFHEPEEMTDLLAPAGATAPPPWEAVRDGAARLTRADALIAEGRPGLAWREVESVASAAPGTPLAAAAEARRARLTARARELLDAARADAVGDGAAASRALREAARVYEGSPVAGEFDGVRRALDETGTFPVLVAAPTPPRR